jgi:hypothetical protein
VMIISGTHQIVLKIILNAPLVNVFAKLDLKETTQQLKLVQTYAIMYLEMHQHVHKTTLNVHLVPVYV